MLVTNLAIIAMVAYSLASILRHRKRIGQMGGIWGAGMITVGLLAFAGLFFADLLAGTVLPPVLGEGASIALMESLRLDVFWILALLCVGLITLGQRRLLRSLLEGESALGKAFNQLEEARRDSDRQQSLLRTVLDAIPQQIFVKDSHGRFQMVNNAWGEFYGIDPSQCIQYTSRDLPLADPSNLEVILEMDRRVLEHGEKVDQTQTLQLLSGSTQTRRLFKVPLKDENGVIEGIIGFSEDITERKEAEEELRTSRAQLQAVFDTVPDWLAIKDKDGRYLKMNRSMAEFYQIAPEDAVGKKIADISQETAAEIARLEATEDQVMLSGRNAVVQEFRAVSPDGEETSRMLVKLPLRDEAGTITGTVTTSADITERKEAEEEVRQSRRLLRTVFDTIPEQLYVKDREGKYLMVNRAWGEMFGVDPERCGEYTVDELPAEDMTMMEAVRESDREVLRHGTTQVIPKLEVKFKDGREEIRRVFKAPLLGDDGDIRGIVGFSRDITEMVRAEEELLKHRDHLETLVQERGGELHEERNFINTVLDTQEALVMVLDPSGRIVRFNKACERITGYTFAELQDKPFFDLISPPAEREQITPNAMALRAEDFPAQHENILMTRDGGQRLIAWSSNALLDNDGEVEYVISAGIDITDRKQLEVELLQKEKLATLGQLTATVSHELRNPLGTMRTTMQVIHRSVSPEDTHMMRAVARMDRNITRCDQIIDEMLDYTRMKEPVLQPTPLDSWLEGVLEDLVTPERIVVTRRLEAPECTAYIDPDRFLRVLINLYENACQALAEHGAASRDEAPQLKVTTQSRQDGLAITVEDNGPGMSEEMLEKIFVPLFSTRNFGVGLGLPIAKSIVEQHGGELLVDTQEGRGTRFTVLLPLRPPAQRLDKHPHLRG